MLKVKIIKTENDRPLDENINEFLHELKVKSNRNPYSPTYKAKRLAYAFNDKGIFNQAIVEYEINERGV